MSAATLGTFSGLSEEKPQHSIFSLPPRPSGDVAAQQHAQAPEGELHARTLSLESLKMEPRATRGILQSICQIPVDLSCPAEQKFQSQPQVP